MLFTYTDEFKVAKSVHVPNVQTDWVISICRETMTLEFRSLKGNTVLSITYIDKEEYTNAQVILLETLGKTTVEQITG